MSRERFQKRSDENECERCGNPPPTIYEQIQVGEKSQWLCSVCMHVRNTCRRYNLNVDVYDKAYREARACAICNTPTPYGKKFADINKDGELRGIVCWTCHRILYTVRNDPGRLVRMTVYMGLPPKYHARQATLQ